MRFSTPFPRRRFQSETTTPKRSRRLSVADFQAAKHVRWIDLARCKMVNKPALTVYMVMKLTDENWVVATDGYKMCAMSENDSGVNGLGSLDEGSYVLNDVMHNLVFDKEPDNGFRNIKKFAQDAMSSEVRKFSRHGERIDLIPSTNQQEKYIATWAVKEELESLHWIGWNVSRVVDKMLAEEYDAILSIDAHHLRPIKEMSVLYCWMPYKVDKGMVTCKVVFRNPSETRLFMVMPKLLYR